MADYRLPINQTPPRRPTGARNSALVSQAFDGPSPQQLAPNPAGPSFSHNRSRTSSSSVLPYMNAHQHPGHPAPHPTLAAPGNYAPSRRLSSATTSTISTGGHMQTYTMSSVSSDIHRSLSSRSGSAQYSYVALMRRQKATVWCDHAQAEDPRLVAQRQQAKRRAYLELIGSAGAGRTGTLGSGKNKHGGKGVPELSPSAAYVTATVPVRLSANEVGDDDDEIELGKDGLYHRRTGSARSSLGSNHRTPSGHQRPQTGRYSSGPTPPNEGNDNPEAAQTSAPADTKNEKNESSSKDGAAASDSRDGEDEDSFGSVGEMAAPSAAVAAAQKAKKAEELRRRGSVDDRTTTMTGGVRLFVANPDTD
ncbi:hypothetical protein M432DRAFT_589549 [Thermoascus aurantiacus ATCC 26904]